MNIDIIKTLLSEKKTRLSELQERLQAVENDLERAKFEEDMYYYLRDRSKYTDVFAKKDEENKSVVDALSAEKEELIKEIKIFKIEIDYIEKILG